MESRVTLRRLVLAIQNLFQVDTQIDRHTDRQIWVKD